MSDDQLLAAARALRLSRGGASPSAGETEERIVGRIARQSRRTVRVQWLLPIAAVLAVSSGWAATRPGAVREARAWLQRLGAPAPAATIARRLQTAPIASQAVLVDTPAPSASASAEASAPAQSKSLSAALPSHGSHPPRVASEPGSPELGPPQPSAAPAQATSLQLYQRAHELHFRAQNFASALTAWDQYLAQAVTGPLTLEARYNRAICLTRLGRTEEACRALTPFARGDYGDYRREEAKTLLGETSR